MQKMNDYSPDKNKKYNRNFRIIYLVLLLITTITIGMAFFPSQYIYPRFENQVLENRGKEAARIGKQLIKIILESYVDGKFIISDEIKTHLENTRINHNFMKIKILLPSGVTIYSTVYEEIGKIHEIGHLNIMSKDNNYTKLNKIKVELSASRS